jgi:hypothetical protein
MEIRVLIVRNETSCKYPQTNWMKRDLKKLSLNILRYKISHKCLKELDPSTLNLGHYRLLDYKIVMKQTIH